jgi:hypothetical protein
MRPHKLCRHPTCRFGHNNITPLGWKPKNLGMNSMIYFKNAQSCTGKSS